MRKTFEGVTVSGCFMLSSPVQGAKPIAELPAGTEVEIDVRDDEWYLVMYNGGLGYVKTDDIEINA